MSSLKYAKDDYGMLSWKRVDDKEPFLDKPEL